MRSHNQNNELTYTVEVRVMTPCSLMCGTNNSEERPASSFGSHP